MRESKNCFHFTDTELMFLAGIWPSGQDADWDLPWHVGAWFSPWLQLLIMWTLRGGSGGSSVCTDVGPGLSPGSQL